MLDFTAIKPSILTKLTELVTWSNEDIFSALLSFDYLSFSCFPLKDAWNKLFSGVRREDLLLSFKILTSYRLVFIRPWLYLIKNSRKKISFPYIVDSTQNR